MGAGARRAFCGWPRAAYLRSFSALPSRASCPSDLRAIGSTGRAIHIHVISGRVGDGPGARENSMSDPLDALNAKRQEAYRRLVEKDYRRARELFEEVYEDDDPEIAAFLGFIHSQDES